MADTMNTRFALELFEGMAWLAHQNLSHYTGLERDCRRIDLNLGADNLMDFQQRDLRYIAGRLALPEPDQDDPLRGLRERERNETLVYSGTQAFAGWDILGPEPLGSEGLRVASTWV